MSTSPASVLALTGVTGALGGAIAARFAADGVPFRSVARTPSKVPPEFAADVRAAEYGDRAAVEAALAGADTVLMVSGSESADRLDQHRAFVDGAAAAGVRHVVYTSFVGAAADATFTLARDHGATEDHLRASGMDWTILRDSFYMDVMEPFAGEDGVIRGPAGDGRCALVARSDVARSAAAVLLDPGAHVGATYDLTGPEALTLTEVARILTAVRGREVRFHDESIEEAYASRAVYGAPDWQVDAWVSTYTAIAGGGMAAVSDAVEGLTGQPPLSFEEFLRGERAGQAPA